MSNSIRDLGSNRYINTDSDPRSWNWNKSASGSRNLGDLLYLMNRESALKSSASAYMLQQESHKGRLIQ